MKLQDKGRHMENHHGVYLFFIQKYTPDITAGRAVLYRVMNLLKKEELAIHKTTPHRNIFHRKGITAKEC